MRDLLRNCYKEVKIEGANASLFQKRAASIAAICTKGLLEKREYYVLTRWLLGKYDEETEECLVHIEELFCEEDVDFTKEDENELHLLCEVLVYDYSEKHSTLEFALMILCGVNIEKKLSSNIICQKFKELVDKERLFSRKGEGSEKKYPASTINKLQKSIKETKDALTEDEVFEYSSEHFDLLINEMNILTQQNKYLHRQNTELKQLINNQKEEADILWWMMNEWSDIYEKPFSKLNEKEMAVAVPVELYHHLQHRLFPYAGNKMVYKFFEQYEGLEQKLSISEYLKAINDELLKKLNLEKENAEQAQWITGALYCMERCGCEGDAWKAMFKKEYGGEVDSICLTPYEFANQFQRELELIGYLTK